MTDEDLPCSRVVMLITDYLDGALSSTDTEQLEEHLADCDGCTVVLEQFRTTIDRTGELRQDDVDALDPATRDELLGAFRTWAAGRD